ncbi:MAG TPA: UDP-N-acetylglucosamine--N-acetylmuramyl-(pentapeptide) pyrophosphoryl-undecaprenol N-acetylglucosamine transferase, partial [Candidatus Wirthbacteria bacterium]|nr:UDP-N-acetylglucosamine--N-acetylmuramyl-(pentapeptide) pyrophosphoryl-undecaprenol N-acetylglucosamine transferase [Candidatus Wirthbacteria bacterium]
MKIVLTGGGTGGHVSPQLAMIAKLKPLIERGEIDLLYLGDEQGMEAQLIPPAGVAFQSVRTAKLRRYFSWQNFLIPFLLLKGCYQAWRQLGKFGADLVFSTGGYVAVPVVWVAKLR